MTPNNTRMTKNNKIGYTEQESGLVQGYLKKLYQEQTLPRIQTHYYSGDRKLWRPWEKSDMCSEDRYVARIQ